MSRAVPPRLRRIVCAAACTLAAMCAHAAAPDTDNVRQKQDAEKERAALRDKLAGLKRDIGRTETAKDRAADALAGVETSISKADRALHDLASEQQRTRQRLDALAQQRATLSAGVDARQKQLAKLLRAQYVRGNDDRLRLLLSGENPNRIQRDLQYMGYLSQAQAALVDSLRADLKRVEDNRADTAGAGKELDDIARRQRQQKAVLEQEKGRRALLLAQLSGKLESQRREAGAVAHDEARLGDLVGRLQQLIQQQIQQQRQQRQRAEAAASARRQQELAQRQQAERERRQAQQAGKPPAAADAIDDDEPPAAQHGRRDAAAPDASDARAFVALRGRMPWPVRGELTARFGSRRGDGPPWKGLFIRAAEGSEVHAIAAGKVVFADWLRGFGNLMIVDHGGQYMSIYANNRALLKRPGDAVRAGEAIASAGNSGGNPQSGLYFEMRHDGRAFDPLEWIITR